MNDVWIFYMTLIFHFFYVNRKMNLLNVVWIFYMTLIFHFFYVNRKMNQRHFSEYVSWVPTRPCLFSLNIKNVYERYQLVGVNVNHHWTWTRFFEFKPKHLAKNWSTSCIESLLSPSHIFSPVPFPHDHSPPYFRCNWCAQMQIR